MKINKEIKDLLKADLTEDQLNAVISFVSDRGITAFKNSNLLKAINRSDLDQAVLEFEKWVVDQGQFSSELAELRQQEIKLFTKTH